MSTILWFSVMTAILTLMAESWMDNRKESPYLEVEGSVFRWGRREQE